MTAAQSYREWAEIALRIADGPGGYAIEPYPLGGHSSGAVMLQGADQGRRLACGHLVAFGRWICCWPDGPGVENEKCSSCAIRRGRCWWKYPQ